MKKIDVSNFSPEAKQATYREARIIEALRHPNIVGFKEVYMNKKEHLNIVMEYCDDGDLQQKIWAMSRANKDKESPDHFTEDQILIWFTQICLGVKHCHDRKIIHRDLKA